MESEPINVRHSEIELPVRLISSEKGFGPVFLMLGFISFGTNLHATCLITTATCAAFTKYPIARFTLDIYLIV